MTQKNFVARAADLSDGQSMCIELEGEPIALFNISGQFYACSNSCPHAGAPLHQGFTTIKDDQPPTVTCLWHGWTFPLKPQPLQDGVTRYTVHQENANLYLDIVLAPKPQQ